MHEVVSGHFYLQKLAGPTSENTFYSTKNRALSDRIGFKKIQDVFFEQIEANIFKFCLFRKKYFFDIVIAS